VVYFFDSYFEYLTALRPDVGGGFGGALLVARCQLVVSAMALPANEFIGCHALEGGAIGAIQSDVVCHHCHFWHDAAFYEGGSICVHCPDETEESIVLLQNCEFAGSTARECGGAVLVDRVTDVTIDATTFTECRAGSRGGALVVLDSNVLLFTSHFVNNSCGAEELNGLVPSQVWRYDRELCAGGAIYMRQVQGAPVSHTNDMDSAGVMVNVATEECCFVNNSVKKASGQLLPSERSYDVFVDGCIYQTYRDRFLNYENMSIWVSPSHGTSLRFYFSRFYGAPYFFTGHLCNLLSYVAAYGNSTLVCHEQTPRQQP
jgi:hypothetical protein